MIQSYDRELNGRCLCMPHKKVDSYAFTLCVLALLRFNLFLFGSGYAGFAS